MCQPFNAIRIIAISIGVLLCSFSALKADENYDERVEAFINDAIISNSGYDVLVLRASRGLTLDRELIQELILGAQNSAEGDFRLTRLLRILMLTNGEYDEQIVPAIENIPYWLPDEENVRQYWSENHMIMWMSADWLMHEHYNKPSRSTLRQNLVHWLELKIEYGYYEYFSSVYFPFTTAGLLNLVDFTEDEEIANLAEQAVKRLLKDVLLLVNDKGVFYPTAGRNEVSRYLNAYGSGIQKLNYLLTGLGKPATPHIGVSALATSKINVDDVIESWNAEVNQTYYYGHPLSKADEIHSMLSREDKIIFNWSAGAYFHPLAAVNTLWQIKNYDMWEHEEFEPYSFAQYLPISIGKSFAKLAASFSRSSYIGQAKIEIFKNNGIVLTSSQKQWEGRLGYQIWPVAATVETECVFIRSGEVVEWSDVPSRRSNEHLPYVEQEDNVALVMYRPNFDLPVWGYDQTDVALHFQEAAYDEVRSFDNWLLGQIDDSYVAVKKHCDEIVNGVSACTEDDGQTWAIVVGNKEIHGSFENFESIIQASSYEERWYFDWTNFKWVYYGHINVDGKDIDYNWKGHWLDGPNSFEERIETEKQHTIQEESSDYSIYPNPSQGEITLSSKKSSENIHSVSIVNMSGQEVFEINSNNPTSSLNLNLDHLTPGFYTLIIKNNTEKLAVKRLIIQ